ncbi:MAG: hypothetical protein JNM07_08170 [Phycisphaerae bacterium]|nr:hypothetical protein [Phycisphaerae bacterium]
MNLASFLQHWGILENPFQGEEARQDPVFARLAGVVVTGSGGAGGPTPGPDARILHSDFDKIAGDFSRPSAAVAFGEKGSGKTAIRLQLAQRVGAFNAANPARRVLLAPYDDLNPVLERLIPRLAPRESRRQVKADPVSEAFNRIRLTDHVDAILSLIVGPLVDAALGEAGPARASEGTPSVELSDERRRGLRRSDLAVRKDLLLLQAVYDRPERAEDRTRRLRARLGLGLGRQSVLWGVLAWAGWIPALVVVMWTVIGAVRGVHVSAWYGVALSAVWLTALVKVLLLDALAGRTLARRVRRQVHVTPRSERSLAGSLRELSPSLRESAPVTDSEPARMALLARLVRVLRALGYESILLVMDRADEPSLVAGDPERMRALVWPLLSNSFLQFDGLGVKLLLPAELRHALFRESAAFFQAARLDKQSLIERLSWSGASLHDLCEQRLRACRAADAGPITLQDLFEPDVPRDELIATLDQMRQPRDAFKFLYQCLSEYCASTTEGLCQWRVPRPVFESVRKAQLERLRQLAMGVRPA